MISHAREVRPRSHGSSRGQNALRQSLDCQIALSPGFRWGTTVLAGQPITIRFNIGANPPIFDKGYFATLNCVSGVAR